jgi:hypothetical protein
MQKIEIASAPSWPSSAEVEIEKPAGAGRRDNSGHGGRHLARRINLLHLFQIHFREDSPRNREFIETLASHDLTERPMADSHLSNDLLAQLDRPTFSLIEPSLRIMRLELGHVLAETHQPVQSVYFPHGSIISCVVGLMGGGAIESGMIGKTVNLVPVPHSTTRSHRISSLCK